MGFYIELVWGREFPSFTPLGISEILFNFPYKLRYCNLIFYKVNLITILKDSLPKKFSKGLSYTYFGPHYFLVQAKY